MPPLPLFFVGFTKVKVTGLGKIEFFTSLVILIQCQNFYPAMSKDRIVCMMSMPLLGFLRERAKLLCCTP